MRAFITGATSGIGEALAFLLKSKGYTLYLSGRDPIRLEEIANRLESSFIVADLEKKDERERVISAVCGEMPDLFINCAGRTEYGEMLAFSTEQQLALLEVNAIAPIELTLDVARILVRGNKKGIILNVSSVAGEHPAPGMGLYGPAKACLTHFSRTLNTELASSGVYVLVSCPGMVATNFAARAAKRKISSPGGPVMTPQVAAKHIFKQIEKKEEKRIFNWFYRFTRYAIPGSIVKKIIWNKIKKRL